MYVSSDQRELSDYLSDPAVRHLYLDSSIRQLISMQLRSMREAEGWSQAEVGDKAGGMKQSGVARVEDPRYASMTLATLKRLAKAFDVALIVRFAPFSELIEWTTSLSPQRLAPPSFAKEHSRYPVSEDWFETLLGETEGKAKPRIQASSYTNQRQQATDTLEQEKQEAEEEKQEKEEHGYALVA